MSTLELLPSLIEFNISDSEQPNNDPSPLLRLFQRMTYGSYSTTGDQLAVLLPPS